MDSFTEPAAQVIVSIIPIVGIVFGGIIIFFYLLWRYRQNVWQIKNGTYTPHDFDLRLFALLAGLLLAFVGFVLSVLFIIIEGISYAVLGGLIPFALGVSLLVFYQLSKR